MKKILVLFLSLIIVEISCLAADFNSCKLLYDDQKYNNAANCFYQRINANPNDIQARFYYAASLYFDRQYNLSYAQYKYIAQKYPNTEIGKYSKAEAAKVYRRVAAIKKARENDTGDYAKILNYRSKWYKMPVKIWVEPGPYKTTALKAFYEWQTKSSGLVNFSIVTNPKYAQIKVYFVDTINDPVSDHNIGLTKLRYIGNMNMSANIQILQRTDSNQMRTTAQIYPVVLHEAGHALGISGHSDRNNDIMYENNFTNDTHLSDRDINTLRAIYK